MLYVEKEYEGIGDTRYCPECTAEQRKNVMRIRICKDCGREFIGAPKAGRCADCARMARNETMKRYKHNKNRKSVGSEGICEICGATFIKRPYTKILFARMRSNWIAGVSAESKKKESVKNPIMKFKKMQEVNEGKFVFTVESNSG